MLASPASKFLFRLDGPFIKLYTVSLYIAREFRAVISVGSSIWLHGDRDHEKLDVCCVSNDTSSFKLHIRGSKITLNSSDVVLRKLIFRLIIRVHLKRRSFMY